MRTNQRIDLRKLILIVVLMLGFVASLVAINVVTARRAAQQDVVWMPRCPDSPPSNSDLQEGCVDPPGNEADPTAETTPADQPAAPPSSPEPSEPPAPTKPVVPATPAAPSTPPALPAPQPTPSEINRGDRNKMQVIFTFDAGAGSQSLSAILNVLRAHGVTGTFFVTGAWANANKVGLQQIVTGGHEVFNHTYSHPNLTAISDQSIVNELQQAEQAISSLGGRTTKPYFRPPYGARNQHVLDVAWSQGYRSVYWTVDALDWKESEGMTAQQVKERILSSVMPGTVYLMHIGDNITGQILDDVFNEITLQGYSIVSLSQGV